MKYYINILLFIVALLYLIGFKNKSKAYKIFAIYLLVYSILDFISNKLYPWFKIYNHFFINIIFLVQFGLLSLFYSYSFDRKKWRNMVEILLIIISIYLLLKYSLFPTSFFVFHYQDIYITIFPLIVYSMVYLYNEYDSPQELYYTNLGLLFFLIINFLSYLTWPLHNISISYDCLKEFSFFVIYYTSNLNYIINIIFSILLLYQLKKLKTK